MAELFSEVYNCYFQVIQSLVKQKSSLSKQELSHCIQNTCFEESILYLLPRLTEKKWGFYEEKDGILHSRLSENFCVPLTNLQKSYLKAILMDEKIGLFLEEEEIRAINAAFSDIRPLFLPGDFYYYDRFSDKDDYMEPEYRKHFRTILAAIQNKEYLDIVYESRTNHRLRHNYLPCRLEYSIKNDCFRLLALRSHAKQPNTVVTLNLRRIKEAAPTGVTLPQLPDINRLLSSSCCQEPVRLLIKDRRNALERAMLQFANYRKNTRKLDADTYECLIYYKKDTETELLIEILSFGPMIRVTGNEAFLTLLKERLAKQAAFTPKFRKT